MAAKEEARHIAKMELTEAAIKEIPIEQRKQLYTNKESNQKHSNKKKK